MQMTGVGMGPQIAIAPQGMPYLRFEKRAIARQKPIMEGGGLYSEDVDFVFVTPQGSKDTVEKPTVEWLTQLRGEVQQGRFPQTWLDGIWAAYNAWKSNEEAPVNGTAIKNWPVLTPAQVKNWHAQGVRSVEDISVANEELLQRIGMGARRVKEMALDYLQAKKDTTPLVDQLASLRSMIDGMEVRLSTLQKENAELKQQLDARPEPGMYPSTQQMIPLEERLAVAREAAAKEVSDDEAAADAIKSVLG